MDYPKSINSRERLSFYMNHLLSPFFWYSLHIYRYISFEEVSDQSLQINGRLIGHRPAGRTRDYTWIQALGILLNSKTFSVEATKVAKCDNTVDHLKFTYNGDELVVPESHLSIWHSPENDVKVERISARTVSFCPWKMWLRSRSMSFLWPKKMIECTTTKFLLMTALLTWRFSSGSLPCHQRLRGLFRRTYRPDFENPAKPGVARKSTGLLPFSLLIVLLVCLVKSMRRIKKHHLLWWTLAHWIVSVEPQRDMGLFARNECVNTRCALLRE